MLSSKDVDIVDVRDRSEEMEEREECDGEDIVGGSQCVTAPSGLWREVFDII